MHKKTILLAALLGCLPLHAMAGFFLDAAGNRTQQVAQAEGQLPGVRQGDRIQGGAVDMPLRAVLEQAYPGKSVNIPDAALASRTVTWKGAYTDTEFAALIGSAAGVKINLSGDAVNVEALPAPLPKFEVRRQDGYLQRTLERWAQAAGWQVVWETDLDVLVEADAVLVGQFDDVITRVFTQLPASTPLKAWLYTGNKVVRVTRLEGTKK